jgi:DNA-binding LacI/PurR family transcriptional regulator
LSSNRIKQVSSVDVARLAGVSRSAVSRTFSNNGYVSEVTRTKVLQAAKELGYRVNHLARSLNRQRSDLIGLVVADLENPFRSQQVNDLSEAILAKNYRPFLIPTSAGRDSTQVIEMLMHYCVSGVIITSDTPPEDIYKNCIEQSVPVVLINKKDKYPQVDRVICDNKKGISLLVEAYVQRACKQIAIISSEATSYSIQTREALFKELAAKAGMETYSILGQNHDYQGGLEAANTLVDQANLPDGIFCCNDYLALGVIDQLRELIGYKQVENIPIAGFDDMLQASWKSYQLTTIRQPTQDMASQAINLLVSRIGDPEQASRTHLTDVSLIQRISL